jgi:hypothetical protein
VPEAAGEVDDEDDDGGEDNDGRVFCALTLDKSASKNTMRSLDSDFTLL